MQDTAAVGGRSGPGVFLRRSTGLVREVGLLDAILMNSIGMNVGIGAFFLFLQAQSAFPAGNMLAAVVIGTVLMAFTLLWVYSEFAAAMPRSGGDYVFVSRALHPFLGWLLSWSQGIWLIFFWIGFNAWFALVFAIPGSLQVIASVTGNTGLADLATTITKPEMVFILGSIINIAFGALLIFGGQGYWRYQKVAFAFAGGSILIAMILLVLNGAGIPAAWDEFVAKAGTGLKFGEIIPTATAAGYPGVGSGFDLGATLLMLPWVFFVVGYAQGTAQIGGEVKQASRNQYIAMVGGVLVNGAVLALLVILFQNAVGANWIGALGTIPADSLAAGGTMQGFNFIVSLLSSNVIILAIIGIGFVMWAVNGTPLSELQATRYMLAWSIDRMVPPQLGDVSDRYHTPIKAIVFATLTGELALIALIQIPQASLLGALIAQLVAFIVVSIAGIAFPYRLPALWQSAGGRRLFGIPTVTLAGIGGVVVLGYMMFLFVTNETLNGDFGVTRDISLLVMGTVVGLGVLWYIGAYLYNRARGVDVTLAYAEIPPE
jgi:amino acid transporter